MTTEKMFEIAVRTKMRFPYKGLISVEDLWDLDVASLDGIFKTLNGYMKEAREESLLAVRSKESEELAVKIEIVKYIVSVKLKEAADRKAEQALKEKKQRILSILADKQDDELKSKSAEELQAMLDSME